MINKMKSCLSFGLVALMVACAPVGNDGEGRMVLTGDLSATYTSGEFLLWTPPTTDGGNATMAASMSQPPSGDSNAPLDDAALEAKYGINLLARAPVGADGRIRLQLELDAPRPAFFFVIDALAESGHRLAPVKGQNLIIEPGELQIVMNERGHYLVSGGEYNDAVFNSWKASDAYRDALDTQQRLWQPVDGETEAERRARVDASLEASRRVYDMETEARHQIVTTHADPLVRRLVIETAWLYGPWVLEGLRGLAQMTPDDPWVVDRLAEAEALAEKRAEARRIATGTQILDFTAESLEGEAVKLSDVRAEAELVLLEFWASWCGPCRVEIPHMKEAYAEHKDNGFEIVSFTIDNEREDWELASEEENLPWLNLGMGEDAEAPTAYSVTGVPRNYLVAGGSGEILATDLRGHKLDEKLDELLGI